MRGGDIAGLLIRQARLQRDWSQEGLCRGICAPSYLSKIEQGKAAPSPEVTELLHRLGLVWTPEPEGLAPCWKALLSGSPDFAACYERLVQPRQESLACSPLAADALLLAAFYEDELRPLPEEWEPFLSTRQLALQRGLQGRWEEAVRLDPLPLLVTLRGKALYVKGDYTVAIEVLRDTYPMGFTRFHLPWVLAWYKANRQYRQACRLLEEFPAKEQFRASKRVVTGIFFP